MHVDACAQQILYHLALRFRGIAGGMPFFFDLSSALQKGQAIPPLSKMTFLVRPGDARYCRLPLMIASFGTLEPGFLPAPGFNFGSFLKAGQLLSLRAFVFVWGWCSSFVWHVTSEGIFSV